MFKVKDNYLGQPVIKPVVIWEYNFKMGSVDHMDHKLSDTEVYKMVQKAPTAIDKHGSSQFIHTEQKIWGHTNDSDLLQRVHS